MNLVYLFISILVIIVALLLVILHEVYVANNTIALINHAVESTECVISAYLEEEDEPSDVDLTALADVKEIVLTPKQYFELVQAKEELNELKLMLKELDNE